MSQTQIKFDVDDFKNKMGYDIATHIDSFRIPAFINQIVDEVYLEILANRKYEEDDLTDFQINAIKDAEMYQCHYIIQNGLVDMHDSMGITANGTMLDVGQMEQRRISPMALKVLNKAGFLYRGLR